MIGGITMNWNREFQKRFGGLWNTIFLIAVLMVCIRFAGAEWKAKELEFRLLYSLYLILGVIAIGVFLGVFKAVLNKFLNRSRSYSWESTIPADFTWGLKYGIGSGAIIVFIFGLLLVDDFLGPVKDILDVLANKILEKIR
jgi:hypothetical protein